MHYNLQKTLENPWQLLTTLETSTQTWVSGVFWRIRLWKLRIRSQDGLGSDVWVHRDVVHTPGLGCLSSPPKLGGWGARGLQAREAWRLGQLPDEVRTNGVVAEVPRFPTVNVLRWLQQLYTCCGYVLSFSVPKVETHWHLLMNISEESPMDIGIPHLKK